MTIYLHIGTEKTGTTSLQSFLAKNRDNLSRHGYYFPRSPGLGNHIKLTAYAIRDGKYDSIRRSLDITTPDQVKKFAKSFTKDFTKELERNIKKRHIILSNEHLSSRLLLEEEVQRLSDLLSGFGQEIRVIVYIRPQDELLVSSYSNQLKHGRHNPLAMPINENIENRYDYYKLLKRWSDVFGTGNITVQVYDKSVLKNGNLLDDFLSLLEPPLDELAGSFVPVPHMNEALDTSSMEFIRQLNEAMSDMQIERAAWAPLRRQIIARLAKLPMGSRVRLPSTLRRQFMQKFEESNKAVAVEFLGRKDGRLFSAEPVFDDDQAALDLKDVFRIIAHVFSETIEQNKNGHSRCDDSE